MTTVFYYLLTAIILIVFYKIIKSKKIKTILKSETNSIIDSLKDDEKIARLQLDELTISKRKIIYRTAELTGELKYQKGLLDSLKIKREKTNKQAKKFKTLNKVEKSKNKIKLINAIDKQIELINQNIQNINELIKKLESDVIKISSIIDENELKLKGLSARKSTNEIMENVTDLTINDGELLNSITSLEKSVNTKESVIEYLSSNDTEDDDDDDINDQFAKL